MGVARNREVRDGRNASADLDEDPDEVDVEAVAGSQRVRNLDVVIRIRIGRIGEQGEEYESDGKRKREQEQGDPHSGAR